MGKENRQTRSVPSEKGLALKGSKAAERRAACRLRAAASRAARSGGVSVRRRRSRRRAALAPPKMSNLELFRSQGIRLFN